MPQLINNDDDFIENDQNQANNNLEKNKYTFKYRLLKTFLLIGAWISFGINNEIVGSTFEDLKIFLNINYQMASFALVVRAGGYLLMVIFSGLIYDKFSSYSETLMAISSILMALRKFGVV
jgi:fucose permease